MPKYLCSYAYDVPHYADFTIEAADRKEAEKKIQAALKAGRFQNVECEEPAEIAPVSHRVFVQFKITSAEDTDACPTMAELTGGPAPSAAT